MISIKIIAESSRPGNFNVQPATWLCNILKQDIEINVELVDVIILNLPFLDEPIPPLMQQYLKDYTKAWSARVGEADGFIFIIPEYNHSFRAVIKNVVDYLYHEWNYKPVSFVSYRSAASGSRAVEQLRRVVGELRMFDLKEQLVISNYWPNLDDKGQYKFTDDQVALAKKIIHNTKSWAIEMKAARAKMS